MAQQAEVIEEPKNTKKSIKTKTVNTKELIVKEETEQESNLYFFYTQGCGWCKKVIPHIDTLIKEGYDILKLDLADGDNRKLQDEVKKEYNHQCGTPYFVDTKTGNTICGFREKDVLEKWANGEEIPAPPRPKGPMPKPPLFGSSKGDETKWKKEYKKWSKENSHLPNLQSADQILERPRPKTDPPPPPRPNMTDDELSNWGIDYDEWVKVNNHLPNLQPASVIIDRIKKQNQSVPPTAINNAGNTISADSDARVRRVEQKLDKLIKHLGVK